MGRDGLYERSKRKLRRGNYCRKLQKQAIEKIIQGVQRTPFD
jgi:hypothetical protein